MLSLIICDSTAPIPVTGVCVKDKGLVEVGVYKDWSGGQPVMEFLKCYLAFFGPVELSLWRGLAM